jgi:archaellum component FlaC
MKDEWLVVGATVPVDMDTTRVLVEEIKRLRGNVETLSAMYEVASRQRDYLMDQQRAQIEVLRGRVQ